MNAEERAEWRRQWVALAEDVAERHRIFVDAGVPVEIEAAVIAGMHLATELRGGSPIPIQMLMSAAAAMAQQDVIVGAARRIAVEVADGDGD